MCDEEFAATIDKAVFPGIQGGPLEHIIAGKAVALKEALQPEFKEYAKQVVKNAKALAQGLIDNGMNLVDGVKDSVVSFVDFLYCLLQVNDLSCKAYFKDGVRAPTLPAIVCDVLDVLLVGA